MTLEEAASMMDFMEAELRRIADMAPAAQPDEIALLRRVVERRKAELLNPGRKAK